jgi:hypothetical protein
MPCTPGNMVDLVPRVPSSTGTRPMGLAAQERGGQAAA